MKRFSYISPIVRDVALRARGNIMITSNTSSTAPYLSNDSETATLDW